MHAVRQAFVTLRTIPKRPSTSKTSTKYTETLVGKLPCRGRQVYTLSRNSGLSIPEVADELGISVNCPGTTSAALVKAKFLKEIILGEATVKEISPAFAFEQLSHMKGGPSIAVLLDLVVAAPTYNIIDAFKEGDDWDILQK